MRHGGNPCLDPAWNSQWKSHLGRWDSGKQLWGWDEEDRQTDGKIEHRLASVQYCGVLWVDYQRVSIRLCVKVGVEGENGMKGKHGDALGLRSIPVLGTTCFLEASLGKRWCLSSRDAVGPLLCWKLFVQTWGNLVKCTIHTYVVPDYLAALYTSLERPNHIHHNRWSRVQEPIHSLVSCGSQQGLTCLPTPSGHLSRPSQKLAC